MPLENKETVQQISFPVFLNIRSILLPSILVFSTNEGVSQWSLKAKTVREVWKHKQLGKESTQRI